MGSSEGWEQLSLYDYYKGKSEAVKAKEEQVESGDRERSESPPSVSILPPPNDRGLDSDVPHRRYRFVYYLVSLSIYIPNPSQNKAI